MIQEEKRQKERKLYAENPEYYREKALKYARKHRKERAEYSKKYIVFKL